MIEDGAGTNTGNARQKPKNNPAGLLLVGLMFVIVGAVMGIDMFATGYADHRVISTGVKAEGTVTDVENRKSGKRLREYVTVSYKTGGQDLTLTDSKRVNSFGFEPTSAGSKQTVYYDPEDPKTAVLLGWDANPLEGLVGGGIAGVGAIWMTVSLRRIKKMPVPSAADSVNGKPAA